MGMHSEGYGSRNLGSNLPIPATLWGGAGLDLPLWDDRGGDLPIPAARKTNDHIPLTCH